MTNNLSQFPPKKHLHGVRFQLIPDVSNALFQLRLLRFHDLLEGFVLDAPELRRYSSLDGFYAFKTGTLEIGVKEKHHTE